MISTTIESTLSVHMHGAGQDLVGHVREDVGPARIGCLVDDQRIPRCLDEPEQVTTHLHQHQVQVVDLLAEVGRVLADVLRRPHEGDHIGVEVLGRGVQQVVKDPVVLAGLRLHVPIDRIDQMQFLVA
ncbi:MAG: hypothetical protein IPH71_06700 [Proteobacteria bacterium]|nr:hypothetical protein [Pseudomonadota bacterium]